MRAHAARDAAISQPTGGASLIATSSALLHTNTHNTHARTTAQEVNRTINYCTHTLQRKDKPNAHAPEHARSTSRALRCYLCVCVYAGAHVRDTWGGR